MHKRSSSLVHALLFVLTLCSPALGRDRDPEAYLRINTVVDSSGHYKETPDPDHYYFVEIYMPVPLWETTYEQLSGGGAVRLGVIAQGKKELSYPIEVSPDDCSAGEHGPQQCSRTHFRIYLPKSTDISKT